MDSYKLKIKIGEHEFDAEGPSELVKEQFAAFRDLIAAIPTADSRKGPVDTTPDAKPEGQNGAGLKGELMLDKIMRHDGRVVSLTVRGATLEDEILLVMLGQRKMRNNESITGGEIIDGLRLTGRTVNRIDYHMEKMTTDGLLIKTGTGRASRYRLTNQGFAKSQELAMALAANVP